MNAGGGNDKKRKEEENVPRSRNGGWAKGRVGLVFEAWLHTADTHEAGVSHFFSGRQGVR